MQRLVLFVAGFILVSVACASSSALTAPPTPSPEPTIVAVPTSRPSPIATAIPSVPPSPSIAATRTVTPTQLLKPASTPQPTAKPVATSAPSSGVRVGAICKDGTRSTATGSGACSQHGGVSEWLYR